MIEIKIDLVPFGDESKRKNLRTIIIANDLTGTNEIGNYDVLSKDRMKKYGKIKKHKRVKDVLYLAQKAIKLLIRNSE
jgi:hypothetical protein